MASGSGITGPQMNWDNPDQVGAFKKFRQKCELMFKSELKKAEKDEQAARLLLWLGDPGLDIYNGLIFPEGKNKEDPKDILDMFENHLQPITTHRIFRYELQTMHQDSKSIDTYVKDLRNIAARCKFRDQREINDRILDQAIFGCNSKEVQKELICKDETLTLEKAVEVIRAVEATNIQMENLHKNKTNDDTHDLHAIKKKRPCTKCGRFHPPRSCPAFGDICRKCHKLNHWERECRSEIPHKQKQASHGQYSHQKPKKKTVHEKNNDDGYELDDFEVLALSLDSITVDSIHPDKGKKRKEVYVPFQIVHLKDQKAYDIRGKVDTGAPCNLLPLREYKKIFPENIDQKGYPHKAVLGGEDTILRVYGGGPINQLGTANLQCIYRGRKFTCPFYITDANGPVILGLPTCEALEIVTIHCSAVEVDMSDTEKDEQYKSENGKDEQYIPSDTPLNKRARITEKADLLKMYPECFHGVGCFKNFEYHISIDPSVKPVIHAPRKVPLELRDKLEQELETMEENNIIKKVDRPTAWVNSLVLREKKDGQLRVCLDPKDLNRAIQREHYPIPTLEEITPRLTGSTTFTKLDAKQGYWNIRLDEESSYLTTFNTPNGRYRFLRMPFGLRMSQDVFQLKIDETYRNCKGAVGIADDVQVFGTEGTHDTNLHEAMERTRQAGLKLNYEKCQVKQQECKFFGNIYSKEGVRPDEAKVEAIKSMKVPNNKGELHTFLGMITYLSAFIPHLSEHTAPLRELLKEKSEFIWNASHTKAFVHLKDQISAETCLAYYDQKKPVTLQVDASMLGLGAALVQEGRPVAFASKALTSTEQNYANIEREMLAIVYGCSKFYMYLYGRPFTVESDHRPLEQIFKKNLVQAPPRLQRMFFKLMPFNMDIKYKPGRMMVLPDALSRLSPLEKHVIEDMEVNIHEIRDPEPLPIAQIRTATLEDSEIQLLMQQLLQGWPSSIKKVTEELRQYWSLRDDISIMNGVVLIGSRLLIPATLRGTMLQELHSGHPGVEKSQLRAKNSCYWPGVYKEIEQTVGSCEICQKHQKSQSTEPLILSEVPPRPWHTIGADLFMEGSSWYLLLADYYSKFPVVRKLRVQTSTEVIGIMKGVFSEYGIPKMLITDCGKQFTSEEFGQFAKAYGFEATTSSPYYPKGHGFIERHVQTVKKTMCKCREEGSDQNMAMLALRATPLSHNLPSPGELLNSRRYKTNLPTYISSPTNAEYVRTHLELEQQKALKPTEHCRELSELLAGQKVYLQDPLSKQWEKGTIVSGAGTPRSYIVQTDEGRELRRNRIHIRPAQTQNSEKDSHSAADDILQQQTQPPTAQSVVPVEQPQDVPVIEGHNTQPALAPSQASAASSNGQQKRTKSGRVIKKPERFEA